MLTTKLITRIRPLNKCMRALGTTVANRNKTDNKHLKNTPPEPSPEDKKLSLGDMAVKYEPFKDKNSPVILDVFEERLKYAKLLEEQEEIDEFEDLNLERGINGVFEIEDLIPVLQRENSEDIFVVKVPKEINYVDYLCIVSVKSQKHMKSVAQFVRKVYKKKRHSTDIVPLLEGKESKDWMALDLGNIALHILSKEARITYDLDSLWSVGPKFDKEFNRRDPVVEMLEKQMIYLHDLEPAS